MILLDYIHELPIQIRFNDIDKLSHLNNACYLTFFELGRVNYFNKILETPVNWDEQGFVLAHTEINHLQPIYLNDDVYCYTKVIRLGSKSLTVKNASGCSSSAQNITVTINGNPTLTANPTSILVSATSGIEIPKYTRVVNPTVLDFIPSEDEKVNLTMKMVVSKEKDKIGSLFHLICSLKSQSALIFCNHRDAAERISDTLNEKGIYATYYHGGMDQDERERALIQFRNGSVSYLITTDLAARGLDIPEMKHVIHYHLPSKEDEFTHRNGRTARMLASGTAYILIHESEKKMDYIDYNMPVLKVDSATSLPKPPEFQTIYISGGKKNKLNKIDIVGFFSQKGKLEKGDLGLIEVKDFISFAAVKSKKVKDLLSAIRDEKMKGKKFKIEVARKVIKKEE